MEEVGHLLDSNAVIDYLGTISMEIFKSTDK